MGANVLGFPVDNDRDSGLFNADCPNMITVKIKTDFDDIEIPHYAKPGDFGMDIKATSVEYNAERDCYIYHTGIHVEFPPNVGAFLLARSSNNKTDAYLPNGLGLIDNGYRGELKFVFKNRTSYEVRCMLEEWKHMKHVTSGVSFDPNNNICETVEKIRARAEQPFRNPDPMDYKPYNVGDRLGQMLVFITPFASLEKVGEVSESERGEGGFGSTGK